MHGLRQAAKARLGCRQGTEQPVELASKSGNWAESVKPGKLIVDNRLLVAIFVCMLEEFLFVEVPREMLPVIGQRIGTSRMYKKLGTHEELAAWYEALTEVIGPSLSPGGVRMYCPVSRAAVHKRIKDGRLSCFSYYTERKETNIFGRAKDVREITPYAYIPTSECKAWRQELLSRETKDDEKLALEMEGAKPDWTGEFLDWESRWQREQEAEGGPRDRNFTVKLSETEIKRYHVLAESFGMKDGQTLAAMILGDGVKNGMSGYSFVKLGMKIARLIEKAETGGSPWAKLFKW